MMKTGRKGRRSIGLGSTIGDGQTDTHTHTHTHTHKHTQTFFLKRILDCGSDVESKNHLKKSKSTFLTIAILPSLLMSLESIKRRMCVHRRQLVVRRACKLHNAYAHHRTSFSRFSFCHSRVLECMPP